MVAWEKNRFVTKYANILSHHQQKIILTPVKFRFVAFRNGCINCQNHALTAVKTVDQMSDLSVHFAIFN